MSRALLPLFAAALLAGCSFPERDNPYDPVNRPDAELVAYIGTAGGVNIGPRSRVFTLDASGTRGSDLVLEWDTDGDGEFDDFADDPPPCTVNPEPPCLGDCGEAPGLDCLRTKITIPPGALDAFGGVGAHAITVSVRARSGRFEDVASADVVVTNAAPVLDLDAAIFVPERTEGTVRLDGCRGRDPCSSRDPDGDELSWSWEILRNDTIVVSSAGTPTPTFIAPYDEETLVFRVTVEDTDGLARATQFVRVYVTSIIWITSFDPTRVYRVFPDFRLIRDIPAMRVPPFTTATHQSLAYGGLAADENAVWNGLRRDFVEIGLPLVHMPGHVSRNTRGGDGDLHETERWEMPMPSIVGAVGVAGGVGCAGVWVVGDPAEHSFARLNPGDPIVHRFLSEERVPRFVHAAEDGSSECWAVAGRSVTNANDARVYRLDSTASDPPLFESPLDDFIDIGASARQPDGTLWVAGSSTACAGTTIRIYPTDDSASTLACTENTGIDAMTARGDGGVFAHDSESGFLYEIDASGTATLTSAPATILPGYDGDIPPAEPRIYADPYGAFIWITEAEGRLLRMTRDYEEVTPVRAGEFAIPGFPRFTTITLDPRSGYPIANVSTQEDAGIALVPEHNQRVAEVFVGGPQVTVSADPLTGAAWVADGTSSSASFRRIGLQGETQLSAAPPAGAASDIAARPDGGAIGAWYSNESPPQGGLVLISSDGTVGAGFPFANHGVAYIDRAGDGTVCAIGSDESLHGQLLRGNEASIASAIAAPTPDPADDRLYSPRGVAIATVDGAPVCWGAFEGLDVDFDFLQDGEIARWLPGDLTGAAVDHVPMTAPTALDVDPGTGDAWVIALSSSGQPTAFRIDADTLAIEPRIGDGSFAVNLIDVQRGACDEEECLIVWIASGGEVLKCDSFGTIRERFVLGEVGSLFDLSVVP